MPKTFDSVFLWERGFRCLLYTMEEEDKTGDWAGSEYNFPRFDNPAGCRYNESKTSTH